MWQYADRLPAIAPGNVVTLGEGRTPQLDLTGEIPGTAGLGRLELKLEDRNPTGSFKARIASLALSLVRERGLRGVLGTSSGNGGAAAAAYAAAAHREAILLVLRGALPAKLREIRATGARVVEVDGLGHDADATLATAHRVAAAAEAHDFYPMLTGFRFAPDAMRALETIAWEIHDVSPGPDAVYAPIGGGGLVAGLARGYAALGGASPRVIGVHPRGTNGIVAALGGDLSGRSSGSGTTISGLQMAALYDGEAASHGIRSSGGHPTAVSDEEILDAQRALAAIGVVVEPAGATAIAGIRRDLSDGRLGRGSRVVAIATGAGYKDPESVEAFAAPLGSPIGEGDLDRALEELLRR